MHSNHFRREHAGTCVLLFAFALATTVLFAQAPASMTQLGTVKTISPTSLTITPDTGGDATVQLDATTKIVAIPPGEKDLSKAVALQASDLQPGDRVRVRTRLGEDGKSLVAASVIAIKQTDLAARHQKEMQEWQRGVGGLVKSVDASARTVTISSLSAATKDIKIVLPPSATLRRYAPGSVRFDDAKPSTLDEIHPGDQLRARGTRSADGTEFTAQEIVTGAFRNLSGVLSAVDPTARTLTFQDLATKKTVSVAVNKDSQLKKIPEMLAQRLAMRLKGGAQETQAGAAQQSAMVRARSPEGAPRNGVGGGGDLQQLLARLPSASISDLQKGDAVLIVATQETATTKPTVITLLSGVEPILSASPNGGSASLLTPWTLSSAPEGGNQ
jgi:hypothetical protein